MIEFTFVGIPMIFVLISIFEISRGMWMYHTVSYAVKAGVRYASVHGRNCEQNGNTCTVTVASIAQVIQNAAVGLDPYQTQLRFYTGPQDAGSTGKNLTTTCNLAGASPCSAVGTVFPPSGGATNLVGQWITIDLQVPFKSAIAMFWPGSKAQTFGTTIFPGSSTDTIKF